MTMELKLQEFFFPCPTIGGDNGDNLGVLMEKLRPHFYSPIVIVAPPIIVAPSICKQMQINVPVATPSTNHPLLQIENKMAPKPANKMAIENKIGKGLDSLFWSIYDHMCEIEPEKYTTFGFANKLAVLQIQEKSRIIAWIQEDVKRFQRAIIDHRITKDRVQEILTALLTNVCDSLDCLLAYVAYYGISAVAWYPNNKVYCNFTFLTVLGESVKGGCVVEYIGNKRGRMWKRSIGSGLEEFQTGEQSGYCVKMKHYLGEGGSALGAESSYKKDELVKMGEIMGLDCAGMGKKELYDKINISCYIIK